MYLLVVDPGRSQRFLKLCEADNVNVDELNHLVTLGRATGLIPHDLAHDPGEKSLELKSTLKHQIYPDEGIKMFVCCCLLFEFSFTKHVSDFHLTGQWLNQSMMMPYCIFVQSRVKEKNK